MAISVTNDSKLINDGQEECEQVVLREKRLRCFGHVLRTDKGRLLRQALQ